MEEAARTFLRELIHDTPNKSACIFLNGVCSRVTYPNDQRLKFRETC